MLHVLLNRLPSGRANPLVPAAVGVCGVIAALSGNALIGLGILIGAVLALANGLLLSRRVEFAADMRDVGTALLVMQLGLLLTCTLVGLTTIVLIRFSLGMAIASAAGFAASYLGMLGTYAFVQFRSGASSKGDVS
jgi:hypothetical protein